MKKFLMMLAVVFCAREAVASYSYLNCASSQGQFKRCESERRIERAVLVEQYSDHDCVRNDTWGFDQRSIWVTNGCRGQFKLEHADNHEVVVDLRCSSHDHNDERCYVNGEIISARLIDQISDSDCRQGETWRIRPDHILVKDGCRGIFRVRYNRNFFQLN